MLAAVAVAIDAYFSAQDGYLSRPPYYDGAGYMFYARQGYQLIRGLHVRTAYDHLIATIAPGWTSLLAFHYLVFGAGPWQAFTVRFWPVALFVLLVYWIVRRRGPRSLAIAATVLTALVPSMSAGVRSSSLEFLTGYTNYLESWYQDDLRPDFLGVALIMWSVAILAEHSKAPTRSSYLVSATFAAAAVLVKSSTTPLLLLIWAGTVAVVWFVNRRRTGSFRNAALSAVWLTLLLTPWAIFGRGISNVVGYLYEAAVTFNGLYGTKENVFQRLTYFAGRIPTDLGPIEGWLVIGAAVVVTIALLRRSLGLAELIYGAVIVTMYVVFDLGNTRDAHYAEWTSMALWIYVWAGIAHLAARWRWPSPRLEPAILATVGLYALIVYSLGAFAVVNWPANEHQSNAQLFAVTAGVADELGRHITSTDCFVAAPGPGWPASIQFVMVDAHGNAPGSIQIDPSLTPDDYVQSAKQCAAVLSFREDIAQAAQAFSALPGYQPYYRAVDQWVRSPGSGYALDRSWSFSDLPPYGPHTLGHYVGVSVTVDLFLRG